MEEVTGSSPVWRTGGQCAPAEQARWQRTKDDIALLAQWRSTPLITERWRFDSSAAHRSRHAAVAQLDWSTGLRNRRMKVRVLPAAYGCILWSCTRSSTRQSRRLLTGRLQVRLLPGALAVSSRIVRECATCWRPGENGAGQIDATHR